jgi:hypothetical protein
MKKSHSDLNSDLEMMAQEIKEFEENLKNKESK